MARRIPSNKLDALLQTFVSNELTSREAAEFLRAMGMVPLRGPGADLLRAVVAAEVWHAAAVGLAMALGGREATDHPATGDQDPGKQDPPAAHPGKRATGKGGAL